jgi:hypothetical protein
MSRCPLGGIERALEQLRRGFPRSSHVHIIMHPRKVGSQRAVSERLEVR